MDARKKIEDYLHLYNGCRMLVGERTVAILNASITDEKHISLKVALSNRDYKPMLYRLEDATPELRKYLTGNEKDPLHTIRWTPEKISRMLKEHYDLYDLIQWGLAVDAKKYMFFGSSEKHNLSALSLDEQVNGSGREDDFLLSNTEVWDKIWLQFKGTRDYEITPATAIMAVYKNWLMENFTAPSKIK